MRPSRAHRVRFPSAGVPVPLSRRQLIAAALTTAASSQAASPPPAGAAAPEGWDAIAAQYEVTCDIVNLDVGWTFPEAYEIVSGHKMRFSPAFVNTLYHS
jgi:hypothetical protein